MKIEVDGNTDITTITFCTECKHYHRSLSDLFFLQGHKYGKCHRPDGAEPTQEVDLISGRVKVKQPDVKFASIERKYEHNNGCGPDAKHFTPKNKFGTFKLIKRQNF